MKDDQASLTALTVLQGILATAESADYQHLVSKEEKELCIHILENSKAGEKKLRQLRSPLQRRILKVAERVLMPGITLHYVFRKRFIEQEVRKGIAEGYEQLISLGAGFDSLFSRLSKEHPNLSFIEIDHPASSALKREALSNLGPVADNFTFLEVDFAKQTLLDALQDFPPFKNGKRTLFVCEGVMMYLVPDDVTILMNSVSQLGGKDVRFVFTAVAPLNSENNNTGKLLRLALHFMSEPLNWLIEADDTEVWLTRHKFHLTGLATTETFRDNFLDPSDTTELHRGEFVVVSQSS